MKPTFDEQLLLAEYQHFSESLWRNEEIGEKRVSYFVTLVTAVLSGLIALDVTVLENKLNLKNLIVAFLIILLVVGILTFLRMLRRNRVTDEYIDIIKYLREEMRVRSFSLSDYQITFRKPKTLLRGGLAEMVAALNALIVAALIYFAWTSDFSELSRMQQGNAIAWVLLGSIYAFGFQSIPVMRRRSHQQQPGQLPEQRRKAGIPQTFRAGVGMVIQRADGKLLAFERRDYPDSWQFPQGGIEPGEEPR
ncbi:MAG: NUDIX domain-containing protein, partial [Saprospiraceae bacterium]|nr:NUDIX domain-containing protein [Saprospiraceae bacterium]